MKKILLTGVVAILALSSCKKDRTCTCSFMGLGEEKTTYKKVTKSQAKANCHTRTYKQDNFEFTQTCKLD